MRRILEDLYFGNIRPSARPVAPSSELRQAVDRITRYEQQLKEQLNEAGQTTLTELIRSQTDVEIVTARENFILGFRLGVRMMVECMSEDDGNTQEVTGHGQANRQ